MANIPEDYFVKNKKNLTDEGICAAVFTSSEEYKKTGRTVFFASTIAELERRGKNVDWCVKRREEQSNLVAGVVAVGAVVGLAAIAAKGGGRAPAPAAGVAPQSSTRSVTDYQWDWDQFYDETGALIWRCRGVQSGQFYHDVQCAGLAQLDTRWPGPYSRP